MTDKQIRYVQRCIEDNDMHRFYTWGPWMRARKKALDLDKGECQRCKQKHRKYTEATTVHHINYVKRRPDLALELWYEEGGDRKRNLVSLCHDCHEAVHGYRKREYIEPLTEERWD